MKKLLIKFFSYSRIANIIQQANYWTNERKCNQHTTNNGGKYHETAVVDNHQKNPEKIVIGTNTHIRGELTIFKYGGEIKIGDNCYVGESSKIRSGESIVIGHNVLISHNVNIMDNSAHEIDHIERAEAYLSLLNNGFPSTKGSIKTSPIIIKDHVWVNFNAIILSGVTVGEGSIIAAGAIVTKDIPPFVLAAGIPAKVIKNLK